MGARSTKSQFLYAALNIAIWQLVTICLSGTMVCSDQLAESGTSMPNFQSSGTYVLLLITFLPYYLYRNGLKRPENKLWKYLAIAFFDFEGNFLLTLAFKYTSLLNVSLLNCSTAFFVSLWSRVFLKTRLHFMHLAFFLVALSGILFAVLSDVFMFNKQFVGGGRLEQVLLGNTFVVLGCLCYSISNVTAESSIRSGTSYAEYFSFFGGFSLVLCLVQGAVLDRRVLRDVVTNGREYKTYLYLAGFWALLYIVYATLIPMIDRTSAMAMNMSFMLVDFWVLVIYVFVMGESLRWTRVLAFCLCLAGVMGFQLCFVERVKEWANRVL